METGALHCIPADRKQSGQPGVSFLFFGEVEDLVVRLTIVFFGGCVQYVVVFCVCEEMLL